MIDYMIYIYAGLAFVLAGGGWFIGWHGGYRRRGRDEQRERERAAHKMMLNAQFGQGVVYDVNSLYPSEFRAFEGEPYPDRSGDLSKAIITHLEVMDSDDDGVCGICGKVKPVKWDPLYQMSMCSHCQGV